jgi:hypothetical protein
MESLTLALGAATGAVVGHLGWKVLLYAVLSLTVRRIVPVALATMRAGLGRRIGDAERRDALR